MRRRAIVTGASSGIGRATALLLAQAGCEVVLAARREDLLKEACAECGPQASFVVADMTSADDCRRLIRIARERGEAYPVLVNAAGIAEFGPFAETPVDDFERQVRVNLLGPAYCCHAVIPWMLENGGGQIINVLSVAARHVFPGSSAYGTSKAALYWLGKSIAADYRKDGIRVTSLLPGATDTPLWDDKELTPSRAEMMPARAVAETILDLVAMPPDRNVDELLLMPPKGIL
jgi:NAD(P)-dependent dehydrogenase (short-subunit alcohol dehydrogenase family)